MNDLNQRVLLRGGVPTNNYLTKSIQSEEYFGPIYRQHIKFDNSDLYMNSSFIIWCKSNKTAYCAIQVLTTKSMSKDGNWAITVYSASIPTPYIPNDNFLDIGITTSNNAPYHVRLWNDFLQITTYTDVVANSNFHNMITYMAKN